MANGRVGKGIEGVKKCYLKLIFSGQVNKTGPWRVTLPVVVQSLALMKILLSCFILLFAAGLTAQSFEWNAKSPQPQSYQTQPQSVDNRAYDAAFNERQTGLAGVYNPNVNGMRTAYGETYKAAEMTASHPLLPLGTLVRVNNFDTGREAIVRVNDRGQECADCLIMLSQAAANQLGVNYRSRVSVERSGFSNWNPAPAATRQLTARSPYPTTSPTAQPQIARPGVVAPGTYTSTPSSRPAVISKEVTDFNQPATYNRYPTVARPSAAVGNSVSLRTAASVSPPSPTVPTYQSSRGVGGPTTYEGQPSFNLQPAQATNQLSNGPSTNSGDYAVQLGAYSNEIYAQQRVSALSRQGMQNVFYRSMTKSDGQVINRVYVGSYVTVAEAQSAARQIQGQFNIAGIVTRI